MVCAVQRVLSQRLISGHIIAKTKSQGGLTLLVLTCRTEEVIVISVPKKPEAGVSNAPCPIYQGITDGGSGECGLTWVCGCEKTCPFCQSFCYFGMVYAW